MRSKKQPRTSFPGALGSVVVVLFALQGEPVRGQQATSKISYLAERAIEACRRQQAAGRDLSAMSTELVRVTSSGLVELSFHALSRTGSNEAADLEELGAVIVDTLDLPLGLNFPPTGLIQAWVPYERVSEAAEFPWVAAITPPSYAESNPHPANAINSEGVALHNADVAQTQGITGAGVTVAAISIGAASIAQAQAINELPAVTVFNTAGGDEGTAMLEIIHDMAPNATLLYDDGVGGSSDVRHVNALTNLRANGANVIAEDLAFDSQPAFQQGLVATGRELVASLGVAVHSSSGNRGNDHAARVFAVGTGAGPDGVNFVGAPPGCTNNPDNVVAIAPGGDTTFDVTLGAAGNGSTSITLQWSEPRAIFPTTGQGGFTDLNLYVMDAALTQCLAESVGVQANGVGDTIEQISIDMPGTMAKLVVDVQGTSSAVTPPMIDLRWRRMAGETDATTRAGSIDPDKNYTGVAYSIGAVRASSGNLEGFSSAGPVNLLLTTVCPGGVGPCMGVAGPAAQTFQGLDFLGADAVSVSGVGGFGSGTCPAVNPGDCTFSGTSASAPHTAACDALVREIVGASAPLNVVRNRLASTAVDLGPPGEDPTNGAGLLDCFQALGPPEALCTDVTVPTDPGLCTASASIDDGSFDTFDPDAMPSVMLSQSPLSPYSLGDTLVELTATDANGLFDRCEAVVTIVDQEDPSITCPASLEVPNDPGQCSAVVNYPSPVVADNCPGATSACEPPAGSIFAVQETNVDCTATDSSGGTDACAFSVTVVDVEPPVINAVTATPGLLWPPNHHMVPVALEVDVMDNCEVTSCSIVSVASNEAVDGRGDGNTSPDWQITGALELELRAERSGRGGGREYAVTVECSDEAQNTANAVVIVPVAHDRR